MDAALAQAITQLSAEQRAVLQRCYRRGWTTHHTAADLGMTDNAVKSSLHDTLISLVASTK